MMEDGADPSAELIQLSSSSSPYGNLEGFNIDRKIGKGQFSVVYRAKAVHNHETVALKKVQIFEMMDSKARLDCMKEIQLLQVCNFLGICAISAILNLYEIYVRVMRISSATHVRLFLRLRYFRPFRPLNRVPGRNVVKQSSRLPSYFHIFKLFIPNPVLI